MHAWSPYLFPIVQLLHQQSRDASLAWQNRPGDECLASDHMSWNMDAGEVGYHPFRSAQTKKNGDSEPKIKAFCFRTLSVSV